MPFGAIAKGIVEGSLGGILERLVPDREGRKKVEREINLLTATAIAAEQNAQAQDRQAQLQINKVEAAHRNLLVAGWRPAVGWICALGVGWTFLGAPFAAFILEFRESELVAPSIPEENVMELLIALLGMGALRTTEKLAGKARKM